MQHLGRFELPRYFADYSRDHHSSMSHTPLATTTHRSSDGSITMSTPDMVFVVVASIAAMVFVLILATFLQVTYCRYYGFGPTTTTTTTTRSSSSSSRQQQHREVSSSKGQPGLTLEERQLVLHHLLTSSATSSQKPTTVDEEMGVVVHRSDQDKGNCHDLVEQEGCSSAVRIHPKGTYMEGLTGNEDTLSRDVVEGKYENGKGRPPSQQEQRGHENLHHQSGCSICLCAYDSQSVVLETHCRHVFHYECCFTWLLTKEYCPYCRTTLVTLQQWHDSAKHVLGVERFQQVLLLQGTDSCPTTTSIDDTELENSIVLNGPAQHNESTDEPEPQSQGAS